MLLTGNGITSASASAAVALCERFANLLSSRNCLAFFGAGLLGSRPTPWITQQLTAHFTRRK